MAFADFAAHTGGSGLALTYRVKRDVHDLIADDRRYRDMWGIAYMQPHAPEPIDPSELSIDPDDEASLPAALLSTMAEPDYMQPLSEAEKANVRRIAGDPDTKRRYAEDLVRWRSPHSPEQG